MRFAPLARVAAGVAALTATAHAAPLSIYFGAVFDFDSNPTSLTPSSGSFVTQEAYPGGEGLALAGAANPAGGAFMVRTDGTAWNPEFDSTMASTWLTLDRFGPKGSDGTATYGRGWYRTITGPAGTTHVPEANNSLGGPGLAINGNNGDPVNGDGLSPGFFADFAGFLWDRGPGVTTPLVPSVINGQSLDSVYLGHFVLSDPSATLVGDDLLVFYATTPGDGQYLVLPLNSDHATVHETGNVAPYWLEYERVTFTNSLGTFTALDMYLVPVPSTLLVPALFGPFAGRRARRGS